MHKGVERNAPCLPDRGRLQHATAGQGQPAVIAELPPLRSEPAWLPQPARPARSAGLKLSGPVGSAGLSSAPGRLVRHCLTRAPAIRIPASGLCHRVPCHQDPGIRTVPQALCTVSGRTLPLRCAAGPNLHVQEKSHVLSAACLSCRTFVWLSRTAYGQLPDSHQAVTRRLPGGHLTACRRFFARRCLMERSRAAPFLCEPYTGLSPSAGTDSCSQALTQGQAFCHAPARALNAAPLTPCCVRLLCTSPFRTAPRLTHTPHISPIPLP